MTTSRRLLKRETLGTKTKTTTKHSDQQSKVEVGDAAPLVECQIGAPFTQVRFPGGTRDFSSTVNIQCRFSRYVRTPPRAIACINICAHVKDPVDHVRVRWIMETKTPSVNCSLGSATLSQLAFHRESNPNFSWNESQWNNRAVKCKMQKCKTGIRRDTGKSLSADRLKPGVNKERH